jgi:phosphatidylglycerol:prolipoprotein diacylglycerol transferase
MHTLFDLLALAAALGTGFAVYRWRLQAALTHTVARLDGHYFLFLSAGSILGSYLFGTLNLYLSGVDGMGRSILGALFGAIVMVEIYKARKGIRGSTGYLYAAPFCVLISVGRIGCFLSGVQDNTHGNATTLPWGHDYGDHILRHPVQLYEAFSMLLCLLCLLMLLRKHAHYVVHYGFYGCVGFYAAQRFVWEFFKPYATLAGGLNIFHFLCLLLMAYSIRMIAKTRSVAHP